MNLDRISQNQYDAGRVRLHYYEVVNEHPVLILLHAQGIDALSYQNVFHKLAKRFHIYSIDCPGHGQSDHNKENYNIVSIGDAIVDFLENQVKQPAWIVGHSSGGLVAAYTAANTTMCAGLILEDPPFFSCQGERRYKTYNYLDLSTVCHQYIETACNEDFVLYYFQNQKMWDYFPEDSREKIKSKLVEFAKKYRIKHPQKSLKVPFFPKSALMAYQGMNAYDPYFGEAFYQDTFHSGILHESILTTIQCPTLLMKAKTAYGDDGVLLAAMSDEDAALVGQQVPNCRTMYFDCGHGVHFEKEKAFIKAIFDFAK